MKLFRLSLAGAVVAATGSVAPPVSEPGPPATPNGSIFRSELLLLRQTPEGRTLVPVNPERPFTDGERFRLRLLARRAGHFYLVLHGSEGQIQVLYPFSGTPPKFNLLQREESRAIPEGAWYRFDNAPGIEDLYLIWSASPLPTLDAAAGSTGDGTLELDELLELRNEADPAPSMEPRLRVRRIRLEHTPSRP